MWWNYHPTRATQRDANTPITSERAPRRQTHTLTKACPAPHPCTHTTHPSRTAPHQNPKPSAHTVLEWLATPSHSARPTTRIGAAGSETNAVTERRVTLCPSLFQDCATRARTWVGCSYRATLLLLTTICKTLLRGHLPRRGKRLILRNSPGLWADRRKPQWVGHPPCDASTRPVCVSPIRQLQSARGPVYGRYSLFHQWNNHIATRPLALRGT